MISDNYRQFHYFNRQLGFPAWSGKRILDFGGNCGNFLADAKGLVSPNSYWCVEVSQDALEEGQRRHPAAHWIYYDRFNLQYNPRGKPRLPLPAGLPLFHFIVAYSVFTHTSEAEMLALVGQLRRKLEPGGALAFTFIDPHLVPHAPFRQPAEKNARLLEGRDSNLLWRLNRRKDTNAGFEVEKPLGHAAGSERCWLINDELYLPGESIAYLAPDPHPLHESFYTAEYMRTLFPDAEVREPVNGERQHICILRSEPGGT